MNNAKECIACKTVHTLGNLGDVCNNCGNTSFRLIAVSEYWFDMAVSFGYDRTVVAASLVKECFDIWNQDEYATFGAFMRAEVLV